MRESIGATWILQLVIVFMLIFVGFLALSINYTKAFKMKNEVLSIVEKYEGASSGETGSLKIINNYLKYYNYNTMGYCEEESFGATSLDLPELTLADKNTKYYYCINKVDTSNGIYLDRAHYEITTFFKFNLPFIGDLFIFQVGGTTYDINEPADDLNVEYA